MPKMRLRDDQFFSETTLGGGRRYPAGAVLDVDEDTAKRWSHNGVATKAASGAQTYLEQMAEERELNAGGAPAAGHYGDIITRGTTPGAAAPAEPEDDEPEADEPDPVAERAARRAQIRGRQVKRDDEAPPVEGDGK